MPQRKQPQQRRRDPRSQAAFAARNASTGEGAGSPQVGGPANAVQAADRAHAEDNYSYADGYGYGDPLTGIGSERQDRLTDRPSVTLADFFGLLRRRLLTLVAIFVVVVLIALGVFLATTKSYDAESVVKIAPVTASGDTGAAKDISTTTESQIVTSTSVAELAAAPLRYHGSIDSLLEHVTTTSPLNSQLISITYSAGTPKGAAAGANAFANAYLSYRQSVGEKNLQDQAKALSAQVSSLQRQVNALPKGSSQRSAFNSQIDSLNGRLYAANTTVVVPGQVVGVAQPPSSASSPRFVLYGAGGALFGLVFGVIGAFVRDRTDDTIHGADDFERSIGAPVLATIVAGRARPESATAPPATQAVESTNAREIDAYRTVATKIRTSVVNRGVRSFLLVRGGASGESHAPVSLASTFARQGLQTALVTTTSGYRQADTLFGEAELADPGADGLVAVPGISNLWLRSLGDEADLDATVAESGSFVDDLLTKVDVVLLDAVNVGLTSSALTLGRKSGAAVVVATERTTTHAEVSRSVRELAQIGTLPLGGVLFARRRAVRRWLKLGRN